MTRERKLAIAGAALAVLTAPACLSGYAQEAKPFPPESIARGAKLYASNCESCHGVRMEGAQWAIDLKAFPKDQRGRFIDSVTNGMRNMPPWGDVLKPDEVEALWAYVVAGEKAE